MLPIERKSVGPMAARLTAVNVRQMHRSLHHIVADAAWSVSATNSEARLTLPVVGTKSSEQIVKILAEPDYSRKVGMATGTPSHRGWQGRLDSP